MHKISIIGGGNMGGALIAGLVKDFSVYVAEKDSERQKFLKKQYSVNLVSPKDAAQLANVLILAVKPQDFPEILKEIKSTLSETTLVVSIAAGITTSFIEKHLGAKNPVVRTMPNMPALIGQGITGVCRGQYASDEDVKWACDILNRVGTTVVVDEKLIDAVTAVSGSGPAYVFYFLENFIKAAQAVGLSEDLAKDLVLKTVSGSLTLLEQKNEDPAILRAKVTSKGGTTQAALDVLIKEKWAQTMQKALKAAQKRAKELSKR